MHCAKIPTAGRAGSGKFFWSTAATLRFGGCAGHHGYGQVAAAAGCRGPPACVLRSTGLPALPCTFASTPCQSKEKLMRPNDAAHGVCPLRTKSLPATAAVSVCAGQHQVDTRWVYIPVAVFPEPSQRPPANLVTAYFFFVARRGSMYDSDSALR